MKTRHIALLATTVLALSAQGAAFAHGSEAHGAKPIDYRQVEETAFGRAADPAKAARTVTVDMRDSMRFSPDTITVRQGEIVRFVIKNRGRILHEMVIGTETELKAHAEAMRQFPGMEHDAPYMAHVAPGKAGEIGWQFTRAGEFQFACLIPGHFEAGMVGRIRVVEI